MGLQLIELAPGNLQQPLHKQLQSSVVNAHISLPSLSLFPPTSTFFSALRLCFWDGSAWRLTSVTLPSCSTQRWIQPSIAKVNKHFFCYPAVMRSVVQDAVFAIFVNDSC